MPIHRLIKSYVRREGRMTPNQKQAFENYMEKFGLSITKEVINFQEVFQNAHPVTLEIGFGMGKSLATLAQENPQTNFIGIEVHRPGVGSLLAQLKEHALSNVRVYQEDAVEVLKHSIPDASLQRILIFFPDPWHKKRHNKRRLIQPTFIALLHQKLLPQGEIYLATDWEAYAHHMLTTFLQSPHFENQSPTNTFISRPAWRPLTKFEARGQRLGHDVWDLCFKRINEK